ncbi:MAG: LysR family transcriptional regulator [Proteobacteria bacterium]|nr:LysR family transcriptional regulator [Pseudomonadota bacterium]
MNWDDLKILLALSRAGSTRKAAGLLGVSNTTVMRRLESLEAQVGGRLFDRTPDGFTATPLADQLLPVAREVEETLIEAERQVSGKDSELSGRIKLSLPAVPLTHVAEAVAGFAIKYPSIELDITVSDDPVDLARREADIAVRGIPKHKRPPKDIVGIKLGRISLGYYVHRDLLSEASRGHRELTCIRASGRALSLGDLPDPDSLGLKSRHLIDGITPRTVAAINKLGVAALPCFLAMQYPELMLLPGVPSAHWGHTWLLHHKDLRQSARIRALFKHLSALEEQWPNCWDTSLDNESRAA